MSFFCFWQLQLTCIGEMRYVAVGARPPLLFALILIAEVMGQSLAKVVDRLLKHLLQWRQLAKMKYRP